MLSFEEERRIALEAKEDARKIMNSCTHTKNKQQYHNKYHERQGSPGAAKSGFATLLWIISMVVGAIFNDMVFIWIVATVIYACFMFGINKKK